jgi:hypothetical protein
LKPPGLPGADSYPPAVPGHWLLVGKILAAWPLPEPKFLPKLPWLASLTSSAIGLGVAGSAWGLKSQFQEVGGRLERPLAIS